MFFHRIIQLNNDEIEDDSLLLNMSRPTIFPIIRPNSASGKFLLSKEDSASITAYSEDVDIVYLDQESIDNYHKFISKLYDEIKKVTGKKIQSHCLLVMTNGFETLSIFEDIKEDDPQGLETLIYQLIDSLEDNEPDKSLKNLSLEYNTIKFFQLYGDKIYKFSKVLLKFFGVKV